MAVTIGGSGNQTIRTTGLVYGDALGTLDSGIAGNDVIKVLSGENTAYGDAGALTGTPLNHAQGGNDTIWGAEGRDKLVGDAAQLLDDAKGGSDAIAGGGGGDSLYGDATDMFGNSGGGNDRISGNAGNDFIAGDAVFMNDAAVGGNDHLRGGDGADLIYGDGQVMSATAQGGDDLLWGGEGGDRFFFVGNFGDDTIFDYEDGVDRINFADYGAGLTFEDLVITDDGAGTGTLIDAAGFGTIALKGVSSALITEDDFRFV